MFKSLMADMIGIDTDPLGAVDIAKRHGFKGIDLRLSHHADTIRSLGADTLRAAIQDAGLVTGYGMVLPGKISCDEASWQQGVKQLPKFAEMAHAVGYTRTAAVVLPFDDEQPYDAFFQTHLDRIDQVAPVLADHGISLALEYVSPLTRRAGHKHPFIYDMAGLMKLVRACGHGNVGVLLDSFHWHCASETVADIEALEQDDVLVVHVNDLIADRPVDEQTVMERALPCETGIIDLAGFMAALDRIGFDGPVTSEPTNPKWQGADPEQAAGALSASMDKLMALTAV